MMRRTLLAAAAGCALVGFVSCTDDASGPRAPLAGHLAVVPDFGALQGGIVEVAKGRFVLTRIPGGTVALDTVIDIPLGADSVDLTLTVPVLSSGEQFNLTITLISTADDTVFQGGPVVVTPGTSGTAVPVDVPFTYVGTGFQAAGVRVVSPDTSTLTGDIVLLAAEALDSGNVAIPGTPIGWTSLDTARVTVTTDALYRGVAVGGLQRGVARLVATLVTGQTDTVLVSNQPLPTAIVAESGSGQSALADSTLPQPLVALVTAGDGLGVAGLWVRFVVASGGGTLSADSALTDATGRASVQYTLERTFQTPTVNATTARLGGQTATFTATLVFAPPATLEIAAGDGQQATVGTTVAVAPAVLVLDADGLAVPGVTVTFAVTAGAGIVAGGTPVTDTLGLAAVTSWTLGLVAGPNALDASVNGLSVEFGATGVAGSAAQLVVVSGQAQSDTVGATLPLPLVVQAQDANDNPVAGAAVDWAAGTGGVSAAQTVTDAEGFTAVSWTLSTATEPQAATATLQGTSATVGFTATALPATPTRLAFTVEPSDVDRGAPITPAVVVTAYDQFVNVATQFTGNVLVSILDNPGAGSLAGTTTMAAVAGVATFADLAIDRAGTGYTLLAEDTGLAADTSAAFDVVAGAGNVTWINPAGGNWSDGANWDGGYPATGTDTAVISLDGTYTVVMDLTTTVARLVVGGTTGVQTLAQGANTVTVTGTATFGPTASYNLAGGTFSAGTLSNAGAMLWSGGSVTGSTLANSGTLTLSGAGAKTLDAGLTLTNTGTIVHTGTGPLVLSLSTVVENAAGALYDLQADAAIDWVSGTSPEPLVTNAGTIRKSGGTGLSFIDQLANLGGTLEVQTGELELRHFDGTTNTSTGGVFLVAPGAVLDLTPESGSYDTGRFQGTYTGSGGGTVLFDGGDLVVGSGATFDFPAPMVQWQGGTIVGGTLTNLDAMAWTAGTVGSTATLVNDGTLALSGSDNKTLSAGAVLTNPGTIAHGGTGSLVLSVGSVINNQAGAAYDLQGDVAIDWVSGTTPEPFVNNEGTIRKTAGTGLSFIDQLANLGGTLEVQTGELELRHYDGTTNTSTGGVFTVAAGATLDLSPEFTAYDDSRFQGTYTGSGGGTVLLDNGVLNVGTGATFNLPTPMLQWSGGTITGGTLTNAGVLAAAGAGTKTLAAGATLTNTGTLAVEAGVLAVAGAFTHVAGAVLQGGGTLDLSGATAVAVDGAINPGTSPGLLSVVGVAGLALGTNAVVNVELGGVTAAGTDFDQLRVTGQLLTLGGTLNVSLIAPYSPAGGESWPILAGVTGSFATVGLPPGVGDTVTINDTLYLGQPAAGGPGINVWIATGGLWSDDGNWSLGRAPIPGDTVELTQGLDYQVTMDVSATVATLTIGGTGDVISLDVGDQTLTITDPGPGSGLDIQPLGSIQVGNGGIVAEQISNQGSVRWTGAAAVLGTGLVSNLGGWTVVGGQLTVSGEGAFDFRTSGLLRLENDAAMIFDNGFLTYLGGTIEAGLGTGNVLAFINGAELGLQAGLALDSLVVALVNGRIQYFNGDERLTIGPDAGITMDGTVLAEVTAIVENQGAITATAGTANYFNDSLYNAATGAIAVNASGAAVQLGIAGTENLGTVFLFGDQPATLTVSGGGSELTNRAGAGLNTAGTGSHVFSGILVNESGADVTLASPLTIRRPLVANHVNGGTIDVTAGDLTIELTVSGASFTNQGTMNVTGGDVLVTMAGAAPTFVNAGTLTVESLRRFSISNASDGAFTNAADGVLQGTGTIDVSGGSPTVTSLGTIAPGLSPGVLTWLGNLPMGTGSTLGIELGGTTVGTGHDLLDVNASAVALGGTLNVTLFGGFTPTAGDRFAIMTFAGRTGQFSTVSLPPVDGLVLDTLWAIDADPIDTLYIVANTPPAPQILFAGDSAGNSINSGIFSVNSDGSNQFHITTEGPPGETNVHPRWSPDRTRITYSARALRADPNQLHIRTADGSVVRHLTSTTDTSTFRPRYSPDGVRLAFECGDGGFPTTAQDVCVVADVTNPQDGMGDGGGKVYVTDAVDATLGGSGAFAWNPNNSNQLAVVRDSVFVGGPAPIFGSLIWLVNYDGSGATPLRNSVIFDGAGSHVQVISMDWSPDGSFIAFDGISGGTRSIFRIELTSGIVTQLTTQNQDHRPVVSPDNTEILFGRENDLWTLMKIPASGGNAFQMSDFMNFDITQAGWDWSPDGSEIVVTEDVTTSGVVISKVPRTTNPTSFFSDANAGKLGRRGGVEIQDRQPSWRP